LQRFFSALSEPVILAPQLYRYSMPQLYRYSMPQLYRYSMPQLYRLREKSAREFLNQFEDHHPVSVYVLQKINRSF